jgi:lysophospholipase L1-like esterase
MAGMEPTKKKSDVLKTFLLFCFSIVIALVLGEAMLQLVVNSIHKKGYYIWPPQMKAMFKPSAEIMPGVSGDARFVISSQGVRGDELTTQHTYRILAIGGSTTICGYLDQSETWTALVQEMINRRTPNHKVWVGNGGVSGLTSRHHVIALEYLPLQELRIDTVVLLVGINDLTRRISHDIDYDPNFMEKPGARSDLLLQTFTGTFDTYAEDPLYKKTALWQLLRRTKRLLGSRNVEDPEGRKYITWRRNRQLASEIRNELPDLSSALSEYSRNLNKMIDIGRAKSVRLVFMSQPTMWRAGLSQKLESLLWLGGVGDFQNETGRPYYSAEALENGMKAYNNTMLRICQERGVECLDLSSSLEKDDTVFYDDAHYNEGGSRKVAEVLSQYLLQRAPFRMTQAIR